MALPNLDSKKVGTMLRALRGNRSQKAVADALGISETALSIYEKGERIPRDEIKKAMADYFGVSIELLFIPQRV